MNILRVEGGQRLFGDVRVHGAKNSVLPILAATILTGGETAVHNCPHLSDVDAAIKILTHLGCQVSRQEDTVWIDSSSMNRCDIPDFLMREMRSSVIFLGAILARAGEAVLSMPGGCELGPRPIDMHLSALQAMGAELEENGGNIICRAQKLQGARIDLAIPSVGATENSMLAAVRCRGKTVITNAAREPEIIDLQNYLNKTGAQIAGAGSSIITVYGCDRKNFAEHSVIPDRIAAATFLSAAASAGGQICVHNICPGHIATVTDVLSQMGCRIHADDDSITLQARGRLTAPRPIITQPYPGFPTDAQPPLMAASLKANGTSVFVENIFKNRYRHVGELLRMGAEIKTEGRVAMVTGVQQLHAAPVAATDLRGGAALLVAALGAEGSTEIHEIFHIDRGYDAIENALCALGASVERVEIG